MKIRYNNSSGQPIDEKWLKQLFLKLDKLIDAQHKINQNLDVFVNEQREANQEQRATTRAILKVLEDQQDILKGVYELIKIEREVQTNRDRQLMNILNVSATSQRHSTTKFAAL